MRKIFYKVVAALTLLAFGQVAYSQQYIRLDDYNESDVRLRGGLSLSKDFGHIWTVSLDEQVRFKGFAASENGAPLSMAPSFDRSYTSLGLDAKINDYFKVGAAYRFMAINHDANKYHQDDFWAIRHRVWLSFTGTYKIGQWRLSLRERPMMTIRTDPFDAGEKVNPAFALRSKFEVSYKCFSKPLKPYTSFELSNTLNVPEAYLVNYVDAFRWAIGVKWRIDKKLSVDLFYRLDNNVNNDINIKKTKIELTKEYATYNIFGAYFDIAL